MTKFTHTDLIEFTKAERDALLTFDTAALAQLLETKEAMAEALETGDVAIPKSKLAKIRDGFEQNGALYSASLQGVRSARDRLEEVKRVAQGADTYGPDGTRRAELPLSKELEKRA